MTYSGVFILSDMVARDLNGEGLPLSQVFTQKPSNPIGSDVAYMAGGSFPPNGTQSIINKITYSNDTRSALPDNLTASSNYIGSLISGENGYFVGGPGRLTATDRIVYSTETVTRVPGANMPENRYGAAGLSNLDDGYVSGGLSSPAPVAKTTLKMPFSTETFSTLPSGSDLAASYNYYGAGMGNLDTGYVLSGYSHPPIGASSRVSRLTYSSDSMARIPGADIPKSLYLCSASNGPAFGLLYNGDDGGPQSVSDINKFTFSSETTAVAPAFMTPSTNRNRGGTGNNTLGYASAGMEGPSTTPISSTDKFVYATDTRSTLTTANVQGNMSHLCGLSSRNFAFPAIQSFPTQQFATGIQPGPYVGYSVNGTTPAATQSTVDKLDLATDTSSATTNFVRSGNNAGNLSKVDAGYYCGGNQPIVSTISKLTFSTDSSSTIPAQLTSTRYASGGAGNNTSGYLFGGRNPGSGALSTVDKMTYATETVAATSTAALAATVYGARAMGDGGVGYVMGGFTPPSWPGRTTIQKINYSSDTRATLPGTTTGDRYLAGVANKEDVGYLMGGLTPAVPTGNRTSIEKFTLASETSSAVPSAGDLSNSKSAQSAYSNGNSAAYNCGGSNPGTPVTYTTCDKIVYQTDTRTTVPGGALSSTRYQCMGFSPRQYTLDNPPRPTPTAQTVLAPGPIPGPNSGRFCLAGSPVVSTTNRMNYSDDTISNIPGAYLSTPNFLTCSSSALEHGYVWGGVTPALPNPSTSLERTVYASDTNGVISSKLVVQTDDGGVAGNFNVGYLGGGEDGTVVRTDVQKLVYSSETTSVVPTADLPEARRFHAALSTPSVGYYVGGSPNSVVTTIAKITYATETSQNIPAQTTHSRHSAAPYGNTTDGYMSGGAGPAPKTSTTDKMTYSTETVARAPGLDLHAAKNYAVSNGSITHGYVAGGKPSGPQVTTIQKVQYSDDTISTIPAELTAAATYGHNMGYSAQAFVPNVSTPVNC